MSYLWWPGVQRATTPGPDRSRFVHQRTRKETLVTNRHQQSVSNPVPLRILIAFFVALVSLLMLVVITASASQAAFAQTDFQANPTAAPTLNPIDDFQANPTPTPSLPESAVPTRAPTREPTREPIDSVQANPTAVPTRSPEGPGDLQVNPTQAPTEEPIDDFKAIPTPPPSLHVRLWICPPFYVAAAGFAPVDCTETLDGVTFELQNHDAGGADHQASTMAGAVTFYPEPGTYSLVQQVPDGYEKPFLWTCMDVNQPLPPVPPLWFGNSYEMTILDSQAIECDWMMVEDNDNHVVTTASLACPEGVDPPDDSYMDALFACNQPIEGVTFTLSTDGGDMQGITDAGGGIVWTNVDLGGSGEIRITEDIPEGYAEPEVWCVDFPEDAADPEDFDQFWIPATNGEIVAFPEQHEPYRFTCVFMNIPGDAPGPGPGQGQGQGQGPGQNPGQGQGPGQNPGQGQGQDQGDSGLVRVVTRSCPVGVVENAFLTDYLTVCTQQHNGVEFTLAHAGGSEAIETVNGEAEWSDVALGAFDLSLAMPGGYTAPIVFCGFTESPGGGVQHPALQASDGGTVSGSIEVDGAEFVCYWFNVQAAPVGGMVMDDFLAPSGTP
jgi:hypothetical protein